MRTFTKALLGFMGIMILVSCSQTQDLTTRTTPEPRYHKVYYKNKIIYKDHRQSEDLKLEIDDSELADLERYERQEEVVIPIEVPTPEKADKSEKTGITASKEDVVAVLSAPFQKVSDVFTMARKLSEAAKEDSVQGDYNFTGSLAFRLILVGLIVIIVAIILGIIDGLLGSIFYAIGAILLLIGLILLLVDLLA